MTFKKPPCYTYVQEKTTFLLLIFIFIYMINIDKKERLTIKKLQEYANFLGLNFTIGKPSLVSPYVVASTPDLWNGRLFEANTLQEIKAFISGVAFKK